MTHPVRRGRPIGDQGGTARSHGGVMANIEKYMTKAGVRYMVRYRKPDGTQTKRRGFRRKIDAANWAAANVTIAKAENRFVDPQAGKATVGELYRRRLDEKTPLWKKSNQEREERMWRTQYEGRWDMVRVRDLTRADIQEWISGLASDYSPGYVVNAYTIMSAICRMAVRDRLIPYDPCEGVELPRVPMRKERRVYLTIPELIRFADEAANCRFLGDERRALVLTLGFCGLRWGEAAGLRRADVDMEKGMLRIRHNTVRLDNGWAEGTPKNGEERSVPMPDIVRAALESICRERTERDDRVFQDVGGGPIRRQSIGRVSEERRTGTGTWWPSTLARLGWPHSKWPSPHDLRHTFASIAVHSGANIKALQRMLGHKTASMTLDVYADLFDSDLYEVVHAIDEAVIDETGTPDGTGTKETETARTA